MEEALSEITPRRQSARLTLSAPLPEDTTIMNFRYLLEKHLIAPRVANLASINEVLLNENRVVKAKLNDLKVVDLALRKLNDGASALVLVSANAVQRQNLKPIARLVAYAHAGVEPKLMGLGPIPATRLALERRSRGRRHGGDRVQ